MYIIGLTGGIASGKSTIARTLELLGAKTFDIDKITHEILKSGGELYSAYVQHFGERILDEEGEINRRTVAGIIFNCEKERLWVNSVAHPVLLNHTRDFLVKCAENGEFLVVLELPLLFEVGWEFLVDEVWAVYSSKSKQIWRLQQRDKLGYEQASIRVNTQMSPQEIKARADVIIRNKTGFYITIRQRVLAVVRKRLPAFYTMWKKRDRHQLKSEVIDIAENQNENICSSDSDSDNLRGSELADDAENFVPVPVP